MTIRCGKRAERAFNSFNNDREVLNAYLAHEGGRVRARQLRDADDWRAVPDRDTTQNG